MFLNLWIWLLYYTHMFISALIQKYTFWNSRSLKWKMTCIQTKTIQRWGTSGRYRENKSDHELVINDAEEIRFYYTDSFLYILIFL